MLSSYADGVGIEESLIRFNDNVFLDRDAYGAEGGVETADLTGGSPLTVAIALNSTPVADSPFRESSIQDGEILALTERTFGQYRKLPHMQPNRYQSIHNYLSQYPMRFLPVATAASAAPPPLRRRRRSTRSREAKSRAEKYDPFLGLTSRQQLTESMSLSMPMSLSMTSMSLSMSMPLPMAKIPITSLPPPLPSAAPSPTRTKEPSTNISTEEPNYEYFQTVLIVAAVLLFAACIAIIAYYRRKNVTQERQRSRLRSKKSDETRSSSNRERDPESGLDQAPAGNDERGNEVSRDSPGSPFEKITSWLSTDASVSPVFVPVHFVDTSPELSSEEEKEEEYPWEGDDFPVNEDGAIDAIDDEAEESFSIDTTKSDFKDENNTNDNNEERLLDEKESLHSTDVSLEPIFMPVLSDTSGECSSREDKQEERPLEEEDFSVKEDVAIDAIDESDKCFEAEEIFSIDTTKSDFKHENDTNDSDEEWLLDKKESLHSTDASLEPIFMHVLSDAPEKSSTREDKQAKRPLEEEDFPVKEDAAIDAIDESDKLYEAEESFKIDTTKSDFKDENILEPLDDPSNASSKFSDRSGEENMIEAGNTESDHADNDDFIGVVNEVAKMQRLVLGQLIEDPDQTEKQEIDQPYIDEWREEIKKDARGGINKLCSIRQQLLDQQAMQSAPEETRNEYYSAISAVAAQRVELESKKLQLESMRVELELKKLEIELMKVEEEEKKMVAVLNVVAAKDIKENTNFNYDECFPASMFTRRKVKTGPVETRNAFETFSNVTYD